MSDPNDRTMVAGLDAEQDPVRRALDIGKLVLIRQFRGETRKVEEVGMGTIAATPREGQPLAIRIRKQRGLETSPVEELVALSSADFGIRTASSVYVLTLMEAAELIEEEELHALVTERFGDYEASGSIQGNLTDYVRLDADTLGRDVAANAVRIKVLRGNGDTATEHDFGIGQLIDDPEIGAPVRFCDANGVIRVTSDALEVHRRGESGTIEIATRNSRYVFEPTAARGADD